MATTAPRGTLNDVVLRIARRAEAAHVPCEVISRASAATLRALAATEVDPAIERRAEAYFSAVVRRHIVRSASATHATGRFVAETVIAELQRSGRPRAAVWNELERGWRDRIPPEVLEECRVRLCA